MNKGRTILAVLAGAVFWATFWVGGGVVAQRMWPNIIVAGERLDHVGALLGFISFSVLLSMAAGYITAAVEKGASRAVRILAGVQLALGLVFEVTAWQATPVWYHLVFLVAIVPATLLGGAWYRPRNNPKI